MKRFLGVLVILLAVLHGQRAEAQTSRLEGEGGSLSLVVDGRPFLVLGGELGNSSASSPGDFDRIFPGLASLGLNTVLVPAYWDLMEPEEGVFDFSLVDAALDAARKNGLHIVYLWFGAWKNSMSCYAPLWFKEDYRRFPRCRTELGKPLEIASPFSEAVLEADSKAFCAFLSHLKAVDSGYGTVIMIQVENEIGMLESARDHSPQAERLFRGKIPARLGKYLQTRGGSLHPRLAERWKNAGGRTSGTWSEVFGEGIYTDEIFMAWYFASYVEKMASAGRKVYDLPMYVNAAMDSRGRVPGEYPSAGPLAHLKDIWHCAAPDIDLLAPDLYDSGYKDWLSRYDLDDNTLFIPEIRLEPSDGVRALYAFGEHDALGFSPFSIEDAPVTSDSPLAGSYAVLRQIMPLVCSMRGTSDMRAVLFDSKDVSDTLEFADTRLVCSHFFTLPWDARATDGSPWPEAGAIIIRLAEDEFLIAGSGVVVEFMHQDELSARASRTAALGEDGFAAAGSGNGSDGKNGWTQGSVRLGIGFVEEVRLSPESGMETVRRLGGDQDHQGRHARIGVDGYSILHVKLYRYR